MTNTTELKEDIAYVRAAADRSHTHPVPSIYLLWAAIAFCGFTLVDFVEDYRWIGRYWLVLAPAGFCLSMWLGTRASYHAEQADRQEGIRWGLHWLAFMAAGVLGLALVQAEHLTWQGFGSLWVLLLALTYFHGGLHLERRLLPIGLLLGVCYLITLFVPGYGWTTAGVIVAVTLTAQAFLGARRRDATN